jgi:O-antigen ligase
MSSFWLWLKNRKKTLIILFSILFLLISFYSLQSHLDFELTGIHRLLSIRKTDSARLERMVMSLRILRDHPFFGIGLNHFRIRFNEYYKGTYKWNYTYRIPDNMYFSLLSETGSVGFLGFLIFIFILYKRGLAKLGYAKNNDTRLALYAALSALSALLANMAVYELFYWNSPYMIFCLVCGFIQGIAETSEEESIVAV